jgi:hypothetical protein
MEKQTLVFTALPNGFMPDGTPRVSVFISPRLWADPPVAGVLTLSAFPDMLDWPSRVAALDWQASLDGGPDLPLTPEPDPRKPDLWTALFHGTTRVKPFVFEDYRGIPIESFPILTIQGVIAGLYGRASSDPAYSPGGERPDLGVLAADPDLSAIARPSFPEPEPEWKPVETAPVPFPDAPPPLPIVTPVPKPEPPEPEPAPQGCGKGCGCGCLGWPLGCLGWPLALLRKLFGKKGTGIGGKSAPAPAPVDPPSSKPAPTDSFSTEVDPPDPPPPPAPKKTFLPPPLTPAQQQVRDAFDALDAFLEPFAGGKDLLPNAAQLAESWDFHQAVAALGDFPEVLRWLGLVVDLLLPAGTALPAAGTIRLSASGVAWQPGTTVVAPRTHFVSSPTRFTAAPRPVQPEIQNGFLRVDDAARFQVIQNDVPGDAVKLRNAATHSLRFAKPEDRPGTLPGESGLPGLRTTGLSLVRNEAAAELNAQFLRSCALNRFLASKDASPEPSPMTPAGAAGPPPLPSDELFAEDLVRGYRIDVLDAKTGVWRSLCERTGTYRFLEAVGAPVTETAAGEGFVQLGAATPADPTAPKSLRVGESLFTWNGWSLSAPRPGKAIRDDDAHVDPANTAETPFRIETEFQAKPLSLPRLRFGRRYRIRARVADLAGNSVLRPEDGAAFDADVPGANPETTELTAVRYEPVAPPVLMLREAPVEGESVERLVVRTPAVGGLGARTERHVAPPKTSQLMAELHGGFDGAAVDGSPAGYALAVRESNNPKDGAVQTRPALDGKPGLIPATPLQSDPWIQADPFLPVKYLPDPQARGVAFTGLPGEPAPGTVRRITFGIPPGKAWPDWKAFRIELQAIPVGAVANAPAWSVSPLDPDTGVLTVELAPAERATVRVNSVIDPADLDSRGVWEWTDEMAPPNLAAVKASVLKGSHWAHLPWRDLTLVHAVQKPLEAPKILILDLGKAIGKTFATIDNGDVDIDAPSTGRMQLLAEWIDPVDDPSNPMAPVPDLRTQSSHVCEVEVPEGVVPVSLKAIPAWKHELHDTKYHRVDYTPVAVTRFREYFPASTNTPAATTEAGLAFGVDVLNSARPDAPKILYIVPVFDWDSPPGTLGALKRVRTGGGLRVYLERPWFSSGDGELLGVVFQDSAEFLKLDDELKRYVTQWGADPIWAGAPAGSSALAAHFPGSVKPKPGPPLSLEEIPAPVVTVAGYAPSFDAERNLWYADVRIDTGDAYWPFVRLALARYQPNSVQDAHLSRVVQTDFVQVPPRREAEIAVAEPTVHVKVSGPVYTGSELTRTIGSELPFLGGLSGSSPGSNGLSEIEAVVERRDAGDDPANELAWKPIEATRIRFFQNPAAPGAWQGDVTLDQPLVAGLFRLAIREFEWFRTDDSDGAERTQVRVARRVVYADVFAL